MQHPAHSACQPLHYLGHDEDRTTRALEAMLGFESLLEHCHAQAMLPAREVHALATLVHDAVRDVLLWEPPTAANDS